MLVGLVFLSELTGAPAATNPVAMAGVVPAIAPTTVPGLVPTPRAAGFQFNINQQYLPNQQVCIVSAHTHTHTHTHFFVNPFPNSRSHGLETVNYYVYGKDSAMLVYMR